MADCHPPTMKMEFIGVSEEAVILRERSDRRIPVIVEFQSEILRPEPALSEANGGSE